MRHRINIGMSHQSIQNAIRDLELYKRDLQSKTIEFVKRLADAGIKTAVENTGEYTANIRFSKEVEIDYGGGGVTCRIVAVGLPVTRSWQYQGGVKTVVIDPLLMAEFGSGFEANLLFDVAGVGQATFPGQTHAEDEGGWFWTDLDGVKHHSYGETPTHPMYAAVLAVIFEIEQAAREVFG